MGIGIKLSGRIKQPYGTTTHGEAVDHYTFTNAHGVEAKILTYGGIVSSLKVPDRNGHLTNIVMGFDNLADYETKSRYFGALVGRYANRIADARFTLEGKAYTLDANNGVNVLHGGIRGFDKRVWNAQAAQSADGGGLELTYTSPDGEEGLSKPRIPPCST